MSRQLPSSQRPRVYQPTSDNPYQATTLTIPIPLARTFTQQPSSALQYAKENFQSVCNSYRGGGLCNKVATYDTGVSDETCTDTNSYYDYHHYGYQYTCKKDSRNPDCIYSDNSDTTRLPYYDECDELAAKRFSRNSFNKKSGNFGRDTKFNTASTHKDPRKVYPNQESLLRIPSEVVATQTNIPLQVALSRLSDRPQSSLSSGVGSAVVDGCGGHCQTFENVCYYFLQVAFTMGILIGTSLSIAGAVLRKSAARNLQVLVYIGALLSMVSALLLAIQCSARYSARKRKKALRNAKRAPIPLDTLHSRPAAVLQQQPLMGNHPQRCPPVLQMQVPPTRMQPQRSALAEHQGIPWWRRKDLN